MKENDLFEVHEALRCHVYYEVGDIRRCTCGKIQLRMLGDKSWTDSTAQTRNLENEEQFQERAATYFERMGKESK